MTTRLLQCVLRIYQQGHDEIVSLILVFGLYSTVMSVQDVTIFQHTRGKLPFFSPPSFTLRSLCVIASADVAIND